MTVFVIVNVARSQLRLVRRGLSSELRKLQQRNAQHSSATAAITPE